MRWLHTLPAQRRGGEQIHAFAVISALWSMVDLALDWKVWIDLVNAGA